MSKKNRALQQDLARETQARERDELASLAAIESAECDFESLYARNERAIEQRERELARARRKAQAAAYAERRIAEEQAARTIAPQFIDYVTGESVQDIELSIELAKAKTAEILAEVAGQRHARDAAQPAPQQVVPVSRDLSLEDYVRIRTAPGLPGSRPANGNGMWD